jgi:hypothetical protein
MHYLTTKMKLKTLCKEMGLNILDVKFWFLFLFDNLLKKVEGINYIYWAGYIFP